MVILSHRGAWTSPEEKNSEAAFLRSFRNGFGTETDVRDCAGRLVISHDPPTEGAISFDDFIEIYLAEGLGLPLALNVKSDGLQAMLAKQLPARVRDQCFFFDMSVPDMLQYEVAGLPFFTRQSDLEPTPALLEEAQGVWLDTMLGHWLDNLAIKRILQAGKRACLVSPELHGRPHVPFWQSLKSWSVSQSGLMLCTDYPTEARNFFALM